VESTLPLVTEDGDGDTTPVDYSLHAEGDILEPENPLAGLEIPRQLSNEIILPDIGLGLIAQGAAPDAAAVLLGDDSATYANAFGRTDDTDFILRGMPGGVEAAWQLRSAQSPEQLRLALDLPPGASLASDTTGGAVITRGDEVLVQIPPPTTLDADGWEVPTSLRVEGDTLITDVNHRGGNWLYPLAVDPYLVEDQR